MKQLSKASFDSGTHSCDTERLQHSFAHQICADWGLGTYHLRNFLPNFHRVFRQAKLISRHCFKQQLSDNIYFLVWISPRNINIGGYFSSGALILATASGNFILFTGGFAVDELLSSDLFWSNSCIVLITFFNSLAGFSHQSKAHTLCVFQPS